MLEPSLPCAYRDRYLKILFTIALREHDLREWYLTRPLCGISFGWPNVLLGHHTFTVNCMYHVSLEVPEGPAVGPGETEHFLSKLLTLFQFQA